MIPEPTSGVVGVFSPAEYLEPAHQDSVGIRAAHINANAHRHSPSSCCRVEPPASLFGRQHLGVRLRMPEDRNRAARIRVEDDEPDSALPRRATALRRSAGSGSGRPDRSWHRRPRRHVRTRLAPLEQHVLGPDHQFHPLPGQEPLARRRWDAGPVAKRQFDRLGVARLTVPSSRFDSPMKVVTNKSPGVS